MDPGRQDTPPARSASARSAGDAMASASETDRPPRALVPGAGSWWSRLIGRWGTRSRRGTHTVSFAEAERQLHLARGVPRRSLSLPSLLVSPAPAPRRIRRAAAAGSGDGPLDRPRHARPDGYAGHASAGARSYGGDIVDPVPPSPDREPMMAARRTALLAARAASRSAWATATAHELVQQRRDAAERDSHGPDR